VKNHLSGISGWQNLQDQQAKRISSTKLKTLATNETVCSESRWGGLSPCVSLSLSSSDSKGE
ncbi:hypothetical protein, partial [Vibrio parahaemolyticus]|uniref:hypothetical protein n=1 Tax=Vibrio parahaemolyticus TaxID=670 RepID=UPI001EE6FC26